MQIFDAYLPMDRRNALFQHTSLPDRAEGAALFADISGFTPLTATLAKELGRKRGAEEVLNYINPVYEALITELHGYGGSVICFSGDAITCWFDDAPRALACAMAMQAAMRQFFTLYTPAGTAVTMSVKVAVAAGPVRRFLVGNPAIHQLETLAGSTLDRMAAGEHNAQKGEVVVDAQTFERLNAGALCPLKVLEWRTDESDGQRFAVLGELPAQVERAPWPVIPPDAFSEAQVRPWILPAVFEQLRVGGDFLGDLRPVSSLFLKFGGIDYDGDDSAGEKLDAYVNWVQSVVHRYAGALLQLTIGDKGSNMFICFGAPTAHEDDPYRVLSAALALQNPPQAFSYIGKVQIGITRGEVWTGACGATDRHYYGVMGNEVNMAARLMVRAKPGQILVSQQVAGLTADKFSFQPLGEIQVKGRVEPLSIAEIAGEINQVVNSPRAQRMLGRSSELEQLTAALEAVQAGQSCIIYLDGEAGIGKSRLVEAFKEQVQRRSVVTFSGAGQGAGQHTPYRAWRDLLGECLGTDGNETSAVKLEKVQQRVAQLSAEQAQSVQRRLPLLNDILHLGLPENELTEYLSPELRQQSLILLVLTLLRSANQKPLCLILDDVQWLDALSQELTLQVARGLQFSGHPFLLLLATRPLDEPVAKVWRSLPGIQTISLSPLQPEDVKSLVADRLGLEAGALPAKLVELVLTHANGNPLFAEELVYSLRDQGVIQLDGGHCTVQGNLENLGEKLSDNLQGLILTRIDLLPAEQQLALKMAAVIGRSFAYPALQYTLKSGAPLADETLLKHLESLTGQDLILPQTPQPNLAYVFKHIITQEVAYQSLLFDQRKRIHRRVAEWYEATFAAPGELDAYLPLLAYHYQHAEDVEKERFYARRAGEQAARQSDHVAAAEFFSRALALTPVSEQEARFELLMAREQAYDLLGARKQQADDLSVLADLTSALGDPCKKALVALRQANYAESTSDYPAANSAAEKAVALLQSETGQKAMELLSCAYIAWGDALRLQGDYLAAQTYLEQAVTGLRSISAAGALSTALRKLGVVARNRGEVALVVDCYAESLSLSRSVHDLDGEAATLNNLGAVAIKQADYAQAKLHFEPALKLYQDLGDCRKEAAVLKNLALVAQAQGQSSSAETYRKQAQAIYCQIGDRQGEASVLTNMGSSAARQGNLAQAGDCHYKALSIFREIGDRLGEAAAMNNLGLVAVAQNDPQAGDWFEQALSSYREIGNRQGEADALSNLGALSVNQGRKPESQKYYQQALEIYRALGNRQREAAMLRVLEG